VSLRHAGPVAGWLSVRRPVAGDGEVAWVVRLAAGVALADADVDRPSATRGRTPDSESTFDHSTPRPYGRVMISRLCPFGSSKYTPRPPSWRLICCAWLWCGSA
jgi:hypothetical protein